MLTRILVPLCCGLLLAGTAHALCNEGSRRSCTLDGCPGWEYCEFGQWGGCAQCAVGDPGVNPVVNCTTCAGTGTATCDDQCLIGSCSRSGSCTLSNGCSGQRTCVDNVWGACSCAGVGGTLNCTTCGGAGTATCDSACFKGPCTRTEQCSLANGCPGQRTCANNVWYSCLCAGLGGSVACTPPGSACTGTRSCNGSCQLAIDCIPTSSSCCPPSQSNEYCGNGLDDDCDGNINEGCTTCSTSPSTPSLFPYTVTSLLELRNDTNAPAAFYGMLVDTTWTFLPSSRMSYAGFRFSNFNTEPGNDFLSLGATSFLG